MGELTSELARDPLRGLDDVPWDRLHHAYGPASEVPDLLRALRDGDPGPALAELSMSVVHQGTRWQVSHETVPFLVALAGDPATPDRVGVLRLLAGVALGARRDDELPFDGRRVYARAEGVTEADESRAVAELYGERELSEGADEVAVLWEARAYRRAASHAGTIATWLSDTQPELAAGAAALLAWFPLPAQTIGALVALPAHPPQPRASANLTLAHSTDPDPAINERLAGLLGEDELVAVTAAVALAYRGALDDAALTVLAEALERELPASGVIGWSRALRGYVAIALQRTGLG